MCTRCTLAIGFTMSTLLTSLDAEHGSAQYKGSSVRVVSTSFGTGPVKRSHRCLRVLLLLSELVLPQSLLLQPLQLFSKLILTELEFAAASAVFQQTAAF